MLITNPLLKVILLACLLCGINLDLSGQLSDETDLILRVEKRIYSNPDYDLKIKIAEGYIFVNGQREYYNLSYHVLSYNSGIIKGESVRSPNGIIEIYYDDSDKCIRNEGIVFCSDMISTTSKIKETKTVQNNESYLLIAGKFLVESNANKLIEKLKVCGFKDANYSYMDNYHTAIAGYYYSESSAKVSQKVLKECDIDSFVKLVSN